MEPPVAKRKKTDTEATRRARQDKRNEIERARRLTESDEQRKARLAKRNKRDRARRMAESSVESAARLEQVRTQQHQRLATETPEDRAARLEHMCTQQYERLATETPEERAARLEHMRTLQHQRLATESHEERATRLEHLLQNRNGSQETHLPLLEQSHVRNKMLKFHQQISMVQISTCYTCLEKFPGKKLTSQRSECLRCSRDNLSPKLYSAANNMSPGPVPPELQVSK